MNKVEIYSHPGCGYCHQAKGLLKARGIEYQELDVAQDRQLLSQMVQRTGGRTLPQIIINDQVVGGFDDLRLLDQRKQLDTLLNHQSIQ
ncbi:glutaredoxin 3 [Pseudomonadota bacterium]